MALTDGRFDHARGQSAGRLPHPSSLRYPAVRVRHERTWGGAALGGLRGGFRAAANWRLCRARCSTVMRAGARGAAKADLAGRSQPGGSAKDCSRIGAARGNGQGRQAAGFPHAADWRAAAEALKHSVVPHRSPLQKSRPSRPHDGMVGPGRAALDWRPGPGRAFPGGGRAAPAAATTSTL